MNCSVKFFAPRVTFGLPSPGLAESAWVAVVEPPPPPVVVSESSPPQAVSPRQTQNAANSAHIFLNMSGPSFDGGGADRRRPFVDQPQTPRGHCALQSGEQHLDRQGEQRDADGRPEHPF